MDSISSKKNWNIFFQREDYTSLLKKYLVSPYPKMINVFRGERTGWNKMFILSKSEIEVSGIESKFLIPYLKSPDELQTIEFEQKKSGNELSNGNNLLLHFLKNSPLPSFLLFI